MNKFTSSYDHESQECILVNYRISWDYTMPRHHNPEYMQVVCEIVCCLLEQLHHPQLTTPSAEELTTWFQEVRREDVEHALQLLKEQERIPPTDKKPS